MVEKHSKLYFQVLNHIYVLYVSCLNAPPPLSIASSEALHQQWEQELEEVCI